MKNKFLSTLTLVCDEQVQARLKLIENEDFTSVKRKVRIDLALMGKDVTDEYLEEGIMALKQYYGIVLFDPYNMHAISAELDVFWHSHILHTYQYVDFCQNVYGTYIHHIPLNKSDHEAVMYVAEVYDYSSEKMRQVFSKVSNLFHPITLPREELVCLHGCSENVNINFDEIIFQNAKFPKQKQFTRMEFFIPKHVA